MTLARWLKSTSNRTFIAWPVALFAAEALLQQGVPRMNVWALPLLAWGCIQYRWVGTYRVTTRRVSRRSSARPIANAAAA